MDRETFRVLASGITTDERIVDLAVCKFQEILRVYNKPKNEPAVLVTDISTESISYFVESVVRDVQSEDATELTKKSMYRLLQTAAHANFWASIYVENESKFSKLTQQKFDMFFDVFNSVLMCYSDPIVGIVNRLESILLSAANKRDSAKESITDLKSKLN